MVVLVVISNIEIRLVAGGQMFSCRYQPLTGIKLNFHLLDFLGVLMRGKRFKADQIFMDHEFHFIRAWVWVSAMLHLLFTAELRKSVLNSIYRTAPRLHN